MGDVNLEIKLNNIDERVIKIEESGGSGGDGYITSVSNDFNVLNKKLSLSNDVTTKLSKVDTTDNLSVELEKKIDKPASATDGQVLTYNGTSNKWEAKNPSASITEPTELEKGIIGGDEWVSGGNYTIGKSVVIDENKLYLLVGDGGSTTKPSTDTTHSIWEETSISAINSKLEENIKFIQVPIAGAQLNKGNNTYYTTVKFTNSVPEGYFPISIFEDGYWVEYATYMLSTNTTHKEFMLHIKSSVSGSIPSNTAPLNIVCIKIR